MEYKVTTSNELYHHGIKGQKWGVRRYQNKDGSLKSKTANNHEDYTEAHSKKKINELSDAALRKRLTRLNMEKQYKDMFKDNNKAKTFVKKVAKSTATLGALTSSVLTLHNNMDKIKNILSGRKLGAGSAYDIAGKKKKVNKKTLTEEKKLARDMLNDYDMDDPDAEEAMELLREIERSN